MEFAFQLSSCAAVWQEGSKAAVSGKERRVLPSDLGIIMGKEILFFFHPGAKNQSLTISEQYFPAFLRLGQHFAADSGLSGFEKKKNERNRDGGR